MMTPAFDTQYGMCPGQAKTPPRDAKFTITDAKSGPVGLRRMRSLAEMEQMIASPTMAAVHDTAIQQRGKSKPRWVLPALLAGAVVAVAGVAFVVVSAGTTPEPEAPAIAPTKSEPALEKPPPPPPPVVKPLEVITPPPPPPVDKTIKKHHTTTAVTPPHVKVTPPPPPPPPHDAGSGSGKNALPF